MATKPLRLLVVAAHPADSFDQAGGTMAHHAAEGDHVSALIISTGARSHHWRLQDHRKTSKRAASLQNQVTKAERSKEDEVGRACEIMGIKDLHFLGFEDDLEILTQAMVNQVAEKLRVIRPHVVITHHPYEEGGFKMHATVGRAVMFARRIAGNSARVPGRPHVVSAIYFMNPMGYANHNSLNQGVGFFRADIYVDITDVIEKKIRALDCIGSQYYAGDYSRKRAEAEDGNFGSIVRVPYAEQFQRYSPQVCYKLPVSDFELQMATETKEEAMSRLGHMLSHTVPFQAKGRPSRSYSFRRDIYDK